MGLYTLLALPSTVSLWSHILETGQFELFFVRYGFKGEVLGGEALVLLSHFLGLPAVYLGHTVTVLHFLVLFELVD